MWKNCTQVIRVRHPKFDRFYSKCLIAPYVLRLIQCSVKHLDGSWFIKERLRWELESSDAGVGGLLCQIDSSLVEAL